MKYVNKYCKCVKIHLTSKRRESGSHNRAGSERSKIRHLMRFMCPQRAFFTSNVIKLCFTQHLTSFWARMNVNRVELCHSFHSPEYCCILLYVSRGPVTCSIPEICHNGVRGSVRMYIFLFVWRKKGLSVHVNDLQLPLM